MAKFDTHGGHFAPQGYLKVNEGGSHEENPNGGVQIGVDPQGVPNMLEEGEPVYNDYVYSDNIIADEELLVKHDIPKKFAGKLYSEIADKFVDEAEERPLDPISTNGLNAMLGRLAEAQEEQKLIQQQKELEEELSKLSPEELDELEAMLTAQEQENVEAAPVEAVPQEMVPAEAGMPVPQEQMPVEAVPEQQPMMPMSCGGFIKRYDIGGSMEDDPAKRAADAIYMAQQQRANEQAAIASRNAEAERLRQYEASRQSAERKVKRIQRRVARDERALQRLEDNAKNVYPADIASYSQLLERQYNLVDYNKKRLKEAQEAFSSFPSFDDNPAPLLSAPDTTVTPASPVSFGLGDIVVPEGYSADSFANGGKMNRFATGGWEDFINRLNTYSVSRTPGGISGTYRIDRRFPLAGYDDIKALEDSEAYRNFTDYVLRHPEDPNVQEYLRALDAGTAPNVEKLFDGNNLRENWRDLYNSRRYDQKGGIYHFSGNTPEELDALRALSRVGIPTLTAPDNLLATNPALVDPEGKRLGVPVPRETLPMRQINYGTEEPQGLAEPAQGAPLLSTLPQYAGAVGNAGLALWNAAQPADRYNVETPYPHLPYGRINLVDPTYNPIDQNAGVNNVFANSAATNTALAQSGAGYAAIPALLASGYNTGRAMGDTLASIWDANNQRHNAVLAGVNNNRSQTAQFNYANERDRAGMLNQYGFMKSRNDLMQQQLNYNAEAQKYAALGQMLGNTFEALANLGERNKILNQINTNRKNEGYITGNNGAVLFAPAHNSKCGGFIKKYKK